MPVNVGGYHGGYPSSLLGCCRKSTRLKSAASFSGPFVPAQGDGRRPGGSLPGQASAAPGEWGRKSGMKLFGFAPCPRIYSNGFRPYGRNSRLASPVPCAGPIRLPGKTPGNRPPFFRFAVQAGGSAGPALAFHPGMSWKIQINAALAQGKTVYAIVSSRFSGGGYALSPRADRRSLIPSRYSLALSPIPPCG